MNKTAPMSSKLALFAAILALIVVLLGAYTRLTDAGLGCPDWPGCYNQLTVPETAHAQSQALKAYPDSPVQVVKAWTEMIHRYVAGTLGLLILILAGIAFKRRNAPGQPIIVPILLVALVVFQALLGMWTVTLKLAPPVVMGHLLGGFTILALLWWMYLKLRSSLDDQAPNLQAFRPWAIIGIVIVGLQIALGGWTSANYAALVCPGFPYCQAHSFFPQMAFGSAFDFFAFFTHHMQLGHLSQGALITIQMTHRIGALITACYVGLLSICLLLSPKGKSVKALGAVMLIILLSQISLGIANVVMILPLGIAEAHNGFAALLLLSMVTLLFMVFRKCEQL